MGHSITHINRWPNGNMMILAQSDGAAAPHYPPLDDDGNPIPVEEIHERIATAKASGDAVLGAEHAIDALNALESHHATKKDEISEAEAKHEEILDKTQRTAGNAFAELRRQVQQQAKQLADLRAHGAMRESVIADRQSRIDSLNAVHGGNIAAIEALLDHVPADVTAKLSDSHEPLAVVVADRAARAPTEIADAKAEVAAVAQSKS